MQYVDCDRAEKHVGLCLGYGYEEIDEPCEQCQNCIKCESGTYQLGETEKDDQLFKAADLLKWFVWYFREGGPNLVPYKHKIEEAEQFIKEMEKIRIKGVDNDREKKDTNA